MLLNAFLNRPSILVFCSDTTCMCKGDLVCSICFKIYLIGILRAVVFNSECSFKFIFHLTFEKRDVFVKKIS